MSVSQFRAQASPPDEIRKMVEATESHCKTTLMTSRQRNPRTITWLHLSDLHSCKPKTGWDARRVLQTLRDDLQKMEKSRGLTPDLIFFTGDAGFGQIGKNEGETLTDQFDDAHDLLEKVRQAFHPPVPQANVFLVPGNHDVDFGAVTPEQTEWLARQTDAATVTKLVHDAGEEWACIMERLGAYKTFLQQRGYKHLLGDPDRLIYAQTREVCGVKMGIAGFNSAWSCCRDGEKGKLWLGGDWQVENLTSKLNEADLKIALIHHPLNWLVKQEDPRVWQSIEREFAFYLHGHEHRGWVDEKADGHTRIAAAACYLRSNRENGYNFVRLSLETGLGEVWLRRFDSDGGRWVQRIIADRTDDPDHPGMWRLEMWRRRLPSLLKPSPLGYSGRVHFEADPTKPAPSDTKIQFLLREQRSTDKPEDRSDVVPYKDTMKPPVDFVIVTALEEERDAVLAKLPGYRQIPPSEEDVRVYFGCDLPATFLNGSVGSYRVIVVTLLNMGRVEAANATGDAIRRWHPRYLLLIGIAGGVAEMGVGLGDILISDQIVDGELQKTTASGRKVRYSVHRADPRLLGAAQNYLSDAWLKMIISRRPRKGMPKRKVGPILTGDKVIAFKDHLANYRDDWPKLIGVEMEAGGVASACFRAKAAPGFLMVRCVSDLADEQKDSATVEKWRAYVCEVAAAYAIGLLQNGPVPLGPQ